MDFVIDGGIAQTEGGHRIEFWGAESSGKSLFSLYMIKKYQELEKTSGFINAEDSWDEEWAEILGVKSKDVLVSDAHTLEQAGECILKMIEIGIDLIIVDGITSLIPEHEADRSLDEPTQGVQARVNSALCRRLYPALKDKSTTIIFINQMREKLGGYGNPQIASGGRALRHFYHTRVKFTANMGDLIKEKVEGGGKNDVNVIGKQIILECIKNKKGKPHRKATVDFYFEGFLDNKTSLLYAGVRFGVIQKAGSYFSYKEIKEQGTKKFIEMVSNEVWNEITEELWTRIK